MKVIRMTVCLVLLLIPAHLFAQFSNDTQAIETVKKAFEQLGSKGNKVSPLTSLQATVKGTFWRNPEWLKLLDLSSDQQNKMDDIFFQYRLKLIDLTASLQKEELVLEPLLNGTRPTTESESKILTQIDRIADARAELEKANSRMLVNILQVLTPEQWSKLPVPSKKSAAGLFSKPGK